MKSTDFAIQASQESFKKLLSIQESLQVKEDGTGEGQVEPPLPPQSPIYVPDIGGADTMQAAAGGIAALRVAPKGEASVSESTANAGEVPFVVDFKMPSIRIFLTPTPTLTLTL